ncbi:MAG: hypothetical protein EGP68_06700 [Lachnospiraceae bacterium]|nr:hypothetical protein [Lachnospiraceae bacterium]
MHLLFYGKEPGQSSGNTAKWRAEKYTEKVCIETEESVCGKYFSKSATSFFHIYMCFWGKI